MTDDIAALHEKNLKSLSLIKEKIQEIEFELGILGIPIIYGGVFGSGHTLIALENDPIKSHEALIKAKGTIAVLNIGREKDEDGDEIPGGQIVLYQFYIRLGETNTWLYSRFEIELETSEENDDEDDEQDDWLNPYHIDQNHIDFLAVTAARDEIFGSLQNKRQRKEFVDNLISKHLDLSENLHYKSYEIAESATSIYELGVFPKKVKDLKNKEKTVQEISKELGITKAKAEKALLIITPDYIEEILNRDFDVEQSQDEDDLEKMPEFDNEDEFIADFMSRFPKLSEDTAKSAWLEYAAWKETQPKDD